MILLPDPKYMLHLLFLTSPEVVHVRATGAQPLDTGDTSGEV